MDLFMFYSCQIHDVGVRPVRVDPEYDAARTRRTAEEVSVDAAGDTSQVASSEVRLVSVT